MDILVETLTHLFVPHSRNNHRAALKQHTGLLGLIVMVVVLQIWVQVLGAVNPRVLGFSSSISAESILQFTNQKRSELGLSGLRLDGQLSEAARKKANDMFNRDYWAHVTPTGEQPWSFITSTGYTYLYAGENLARDFGDPQAVVDAWMASASHRDNLLNSNYNDIGIAVESGDLGGVQTTLVVQMFGTRRVATSPSQLAGSSTETNDLAEAPTLTPTAAASPTPVAVVASDGKGVDVENFNGVNLGEENVAGTQLSWLSPFEVSKAIGLAVVLLLGTALVIDEVVMRQRHLGRIAGRSWAHLMFLLMTIGILWLSKAGVIL